MNINATLIGQMLSFVVFVWFTMKYVWTPIMGALDARRKEIADGLATAERGRTEQKLAQERAAEYLKDAKAQGAEVIGHAQKRAGEIIDEAKNEARAEGERLLTAAKAEIEREANRAREALRVRVGELAVLGAERILRREIDAEAHREIVNALAKEI